MMLEQLTKGIRYLLEKQDEDDLEDAMEMWNDDFGDEEEIEFANRARSKQTTFL